MAWLARIWNALRPGRLQRDLDRELRFHLTERAEDLASRGMSEADALRNARRQFGNFTVEMERTRDMDINGWLGAAARNLRLALRGLGKSPAFTLTVVLTLALGIGANSAVFSAIDAVLLRPLPFPHGDQLMKLSQHDGRSSIVFVAPTRLEDWNRLCDAFPGITGYYAEDESELSGELPEKLTRALVAPRFLRVLGVAPQVGRDFTPQEEHFGGPAAVLISDRLWRRRFGASPNVTSKTLRFGKTPTPIIGVMPASFRFPDRDTDLWSVSPPDAPYAQNRANTWFTTIGRLKPGVSVAQARANLATVQVDLGRQFPATDGKLQTAVEPLKEVTVGGVRRSLVVLFGSVTLLLLIACINIAALLLSRAAARQHEFSVRFSLGASRFSVAVQFLTEVLVLALAGSALGLTLAAAASRLFRSLAQDLPRIEEIALDWRIVLYSLVCALAVTLACGLFPAIRGTRCDLSSALAQTGRSRMGGRGHLQFVLVGAQVALAVTLLAGAGLLLRSFQALSRVSPGFDAERILSFHVSMSWGETSDQKAATQRAEWLLEALRAVPGVESAADSLSLPGVPGRSQVEVALVEGRTDPGQKMIVQGQFISPDYFATLRIPLLSGEVCRDPAGPPCMLVNRSFADRYMPGESPLRHHLIQPGNSYMPAAEIRGVVGDAREMGMDQAPSPAVYWCLPNVQPGLFFLVRTHGDPHAMTESIRRAVHAAEPLRSVYDLTPLAEHISGAYAETRLRTILLAFFAATAVLLACVGLYGTLSYLVSVRQREVGLRLALGAMRGQIVRQFLGRGLMVCLLGCAAGLGLANIFGHLLAGMLYGVSPSDVPTLTFVIATIAAVSVLASLLPAVRAARLDPMQVLREE